MRNILFILVIGGMLMKVDSAPRPISADDNRVNFELADRITYASLRRSYSDRRVYPNWSADGHSFWYVINTAGGMAHFEIDIRKREKTRTDLKYEDLYNGSYRFSYKKNRYEFNIYSGTTRMIDAPEPEKGIKSPNRRHMIRVRGDNLFYENLESGEEPVQITSDGTPFHSYRIQDDYNYTDRLKQKGDTAGLPNIIWNPSSEYFLVFRTDVRHLKDMWVLNSLEEERPVLVTYKQRQPSEKRRINELHCYNLEEKRMKKLYRSSTYSYRFLGWESDTRASIFKIQAGQMEGDLVRYDLKTGKETPLFREKPGGIIIVKDIIRLPAGQFLWWSRRDGYGHYYKYDVKGDLLGRVTGGDYNVDSIISLNPQSGAFYYLANGETIGSNPYYMNLFKGNLKNRRAMRLTSEDADHQVYLSPANQFFVDRFSRVDLPYRSVLKDIEGREIMRLEESDTSQIEALGWKMPERFTVTAADGETQLYGVLRKPFDFDPGRRYPVITYVYPGPQYNLVPTKFFTELNNVHLAQFGFIVVMGDMRGSSYSRSLRFSEYYRQNLRDYPLQDNKVMIEQLAARYGYIDGKRVGIYGGSSGAYMAAAAVFKYPDFYRVAVARAGQHHPPIFHGYWSDSFQGTDSADRTIAGPSNLPLVSGLKGHLLIMHGEIDTLVHPSNSARLAEALMAAGKEFDYFIVPGTGHGWSRNHYRYEQRKIELYFIEHLLNYNKKSVNIFEN